MSSSLIPERPLLISPTLAATIGLEEAVMLHVLSELLQRQPGQPWLVVDGNVLNGAMPFWNQAEIRRVQDNLVAKGLIEVKTDGGKTRIAFASPVRHG